MRQAITQVIIRKYLIGAIYTIISCGQSVKGVVSVSIGRGWSGVVMWLDDTGSPLYSTASCS